LYEVVEKSIKIQFNKKKKQNHKKLTSCKRIKTVVNSCGKKFLDTLNALIIIIYSITVYCIPTYFKENIPKMIKNTSM